ncbi:MAG: CdaR family protein [Bacteroidota bacterium]|nr:CdaR family protein [Bacteroidota bacterium]
MKKNLIIIFLSFFFSIVLWVSITLSNWYYSSVTVPIRIANSSDNLTASKLSADYALIKIKGTGWNLLGFFISGSHEYLVNIPNEAGYKNIRLFSGAVENQFLSSGVEITDIKPDSISLFIEKYIVKKIKIKLDTSITFKQGYGYAANIKVIPDSVEVSGAASVINNIGYISTNRINLKEIDEKTYLTVPLNRSAKIDLSIKEVKVVIDAQQIVDKNIEDIDIAILNKPDDREIVLIPNKIGISISGGIDYLGKLSPNSIKAFVRYQDIESDTLESIKPNLTLPNNVNLVFVKPERIKYIIKKISK